MDDSALDDLLRRMATLIAKLDAHYDQLVAGVEEQRAFNRQQVQINARLEALMQTAIPQRPNGQDA